MKKAVTTLILVLSFACNLSAQENLDKMQWWSDAKFGMFVHWGPYCLYGGVYNGHRQARGGAEWILNRCKIPVAEYVENARNFHPDGFDADALVETAQAAGMKYLVLTAKHHDGFAMYHSQVDSFNIIDHTGFTRDVLDEVVQSCRRHGMKFGFYYSQIEDWTHPGGTAGRRMMKEGWPNPDSTRINQYILEHEGHWDPVQLTKSFDEFFEEVSLPQIRELLSRYPDVSTIFFDYPKVISSEQARKIMDVIDQYCPQAVVNDRLRRPDFPGDYKTPECMIPTQEDVAGVYWETCNNVGNSWGYKSWENKWKSSDRIIDDIIKIAARGGNLLLNVGPDPQGQIPQPALDCLDGVGKWFDRYGEIIYGSQRSLISVPWGEVIRKDYRRASSLYLCIYKYPEGGVLSFDSPLPVRRAYCMDSGEALKLTAAGIQLPAMPEGAKRMIVRLDLKGKLPKNEIRTNTDNYFKVLDAE